MGVFNALGAALKVIAAPASEWLKGRAAKAKVKAEGKVKIEMVKIEALAAAAIRETEHNLTYDMQAMKNMQASAKDEIVLAAFLFPFILSFLAPFIDQFYGTALAAGVSDAWATVGLAPDWYKWVMIGIVSAVYGLRWLFSVQNPLKRKKAQ